jgi:hypothetical protein
VLNISFRNILLFCIFPVLFILTGSYVSAIETVKVNPVSLSMKKGETKNLTLTGKNLSKAKSAVVLFKNSPRKEFSAKLSCKGATRCVVILTLKGQIAAGSYSVKLFDAKKKPIAEGGFKLSPLSGKTVPSSGQALRSKPKRTPPPVTKVAPRPSREIRSKPKQAPPKSTRPRLSEKTRVIPSSLAKLIGIKLAKKKAGPGETVQGTVILTGKAPSPKEVRIALSSSDSKMAKIKPVQIRAGQTQANFRFKTGSAPGTVTITAKLGKVTRVAKLMVIQAPFRPVTIAPGTLQMTGRCPTPFKPITIAPGTLQMTGRRPAPFKPVTIAPGTLQMTGRRPAPLSGSPVKGK